MAPRGWFRLPTRSRSDARDAVEEELAFHLERLVEEKVAEGMDPAEARRRARADFGDVEETVRYCTEHTVRRERRHRWRGHLDDLRQNVTYALRRLGRSPGYAAVVVLTLALGIAANTTVFSVLNPYFLRPLPFGDADRLVQVHQISEWDQDRHSIGQFEDWMARTRSLSEGALYRYGFVNLTGDEGAERVQVARVSADLFEVLRASPALGRTFGPGEDGPDGAALTVLGHGLWERRFGGDPDVLGRILLIDGTPHTVVGVMPRDFVFPFGGVKLWTPIRASAATEDRAANAFIFVGRLAEGSTLEDARAELAAVQRELAALHPESDAGFVGVNVLPIREALNFAWEVLRISFALLIAAMAFVLLLACVNVAGLSLGRLAERAPEMAVRTALGAGRRRLVGQLIVEATLLAVAGGALGVALSYAAVETLGPLLPDDLYRVGGASIDGRVLAFTALITLLTPLLFALAPALKASRADLTGALEAGSRGVSAGGGSVRGRRLLVVAQVAVAVVLITGAGLMVRSFQRLEAMDLGFDAERVLTVEATLPEATYPAREELTTFFRRAEEELARLPDVEATGRVYPLPLNHETLTVSVGTAATEGADARPGAHWFRVSPGYFDAMGIALSAGRAFDRSDEEEGVRSVIVNATLAERFWPGRAAVGRTLLYGDEDDPVAATVVGVVEPIRHGSVTEAPPSQIYLPMEASPRRRQFVVAAAGRPPATLVPDARRALQRVDPDLPVDVRPLEAVVRENTFQWSIPSLVLGAFGLVALLLAALGVYGVVSYRVQQRRKELGIRIALGASAAQLRTAVLREGLGLTTVGVALGLVGALVAARAMASLLFGISPFDPVTFGVAVAVLATVAVVASLLPALRASKVEPLEVLRNE